MEIGVTVVGKITLPEKAAKKAKVVQEKPYCHSHFRERLYERYKIAITIEELLQICNNPLMNEKKADDGTRKGYLNIKGERVLVIKNNKGQLMTALPPHAR